MCGREIASEEFGKMNRVLKSLPAREKPFDGDMICATINTKFSRRSEAWAYHVVSVSNSQLLSQGSRRVVVVSIVCTADSYRGHS